MKKYKLEFQSFSDVITNSSSTVFLVDNDTAEELTKMVPSECLWKHEFTWDMICPEVLNISDISTLTLTQEDEIERILYTVEDNAKILFDILSPYKDKLVIKHQELFDFTNIYGLDKLFAKMYYDFCQDNKELIEDKLIGKIYVDIEDHFENPEEVYDYAKDHSIWWEYCH